MINNFIEAIDPLEESLKYILNKLDYQIKLDIEEIRIRINRPLMIKVYSNNYYVYNNGKIGINYNNIYIISKQEIQNSFQKICKYSVYSYQEEINQGFITLDGGHRVGLCGTAILNNGKIVNIKNISSLNIRIARNIVSISNELLQLIMKNKLYSILICGPPGSGKTTLLKDMLRKISLGKCGKIYNISVIDERRELSEIQGINNLQTYKNELGNIDIFHGYSKIDGALIAIRSMAPDIVVFDELGSYEETEMLKMIFNCGVKIIASIHAKDEKELYLKPNIKSLLDIPTFEKIIILNSEKIGSIKKIISLS